MFLSDSGLSARWETRHEKDPRRRRRLDGVAGWLH